MTYHVEVRVLGGLRTDTTTRSRHQAEVRRDELARRGDIAEVRTGGGRLVIDASGRSL